MVELIYNNDYVKVSGNHNFDIVKAINETCSYTVPSAEWSSKYQLGNWDGKISLFSKRTMCFPAGLLPAVTDLLTEIKVQFTVTDSRLLPTKQKLSVVDLGLHSFRDYQELGIKKIRENKITKEPARNNARVFLLSKIIFVVKILSSSRENKQNNEKK